VETVVVVGNPKRASRTRAAAEGVVKSLTGSGPTSIIELADLGPQLLTWGNPEVARAKETVKGADLLVVASPTYKATYSGLTKLFLDQFGAGELAGLVTIALMLGGSMRHALAPELTLRPVLVEIGCSCPMAALYLLETDSSAEAIPAAWLAQAERAISRLVGER
jgi:FMN reductase